MTIPGVHLGGGVLRALRGASVVIDEFVSLTSTDEVDGVEVTKPVLCWWINGKIHVHPDRWEQFRTLIPAKESN